MSQRQFNVLGPLEVTIGGITIPRLRPRVQALLAVLLINGASNSVPTDTLIDRLWGTAPPRRPLQALHTSVSRLRVALEFEDRCGSPSPLVRSGRGYMLDVAPDSIDAHKFSVLVDKARHLPPGDANRQLKTAHALWRGPAYADLMFEELAQAEIRRLEELRARSIELHNDVRLDLGQHADLIPELEQNVIAYPFRELLWAQLMLALYRSHRQSEALYAYQRLRTLLAEHAGLNPSATVANLELAILNHDHMLDHGVPVRAICEATQGAAPGRRHLAPR